MGTINKARLESEPVKSREEFEGKSYVIKLKELIAKYGDMRLIPLAELAPIRLEAANDKGYLKGDYVIHAVEYMTLSDKANVISEAANDNKTSDMANTAQFAADGDEVAHGNKTSTTSEEAGKRQNWRGNGGHMRLKQLESIFRHKLGLIRTSSGKTMSQVEFCRIACISRVTYNRVVTEDYWKTVDGKRVKDFRAVERIGRVRERVEALL